MRHGALMAAAEEVLDAIFQHHRPANIALSEWGRTHRFAGARDRSAIGTLVYDVLRKKLSLAAQMDSDSARALVIAAAPGALGLSTDQVVSAAADGDYAIGALSQSEQAGLVATLKDDCADHIKANIPSWMMPKLAASFGNSIVAEGQALAERAPVDLRANTLKGSRHRLFTALSQFNPELTPFATHGVRIPSPGPNQKSPAVEREAAHGKGWFEVQDEGSQLASLLAGVGPRMQVLDLCAGAGGKTLALAAEMQNTGQLYAYDKDKSQLRPIFDRLRRAGVRNAQILTAGDEKSLRALGPRFDVVFVDAPCSGSGTWRRRPDSKWRLTEAALEKRSEDQRAVLLLARGLVRPGGRLIYVTCSILPQENEEQIDWFLSEGDGFSLQSNADVLTTAFNDPSLLTSARDDHRGLLLTPARHATDGFFIASLKRQENDSL